MPTALRCSAKPDWLARTGLGGESRCDTVPNDEQKQTENMEEVYLFVYFRIFSHHLMRFRTVRLVELFINPTCRNRFR